MAFMSRLAANQFAAVSRMRWQTLVNSMRTSRGRGEVAATVLALIFLFVLSVGPGVGMALGAAAAVEENSPLLLALLLWVVFLVWQLFPAISLNMTQGFDTSSLLRYPMRLATFGAIWITSGALEPATVVCTVWLFGIAVGIGITSVPLLPWALVVLLLFAFANLLLSRLVMAWLDRLLARRRTREIVGVLLVVFSLGIQAFGQLSYRLRGVFGAIHPYVTLIKRLQDWTPPGTVARAVISTAPGIAFRATLLLFAYIVAFASLLGVRLRALYRGENLSEGAHANVKDKRAESPRAGIERLGFSNEVAAVYGKELRTVFRSGQLILTLLVMPLFLMLVFSRGGRAHLGGTIFGAGAAYSILLLTQLSYNQFGVEQSAVQFYYVSPVRWRQIAVGKNLAHTTILLLQCVLLFAALAIVGSTPDMRNLVLTILSVSFAAIANFSAGNVLSFYFPRKVDYARMNRRQASMAAGLAALGVQLVIFGITIPAFFAIERYFDVWIGVVLFCFLNAGAAILYRAVLTQLDGIAIRKQDELISELSKAA
jgi:ABC-2 type transport system permease protein